MCAKSFDQHAIASMHVGRPSSPCIPMVCEGLATEDSGETIVGQACMDGVRARWANVLEPVLTTN